MKKIGHLHNDSLNSIARWIDPAATVANVCQFYHVYHICAKHTWYCFYKLYHNIQQIQFLFKWPSFTELFQVRMGLKNKALWFVEQAFIGQMPSVLPNQVSKHCKWYSMSMTILIKPVEQKTI